MVGLSGCMDAPKENNNNPQHKEEVAKQEIVKQEDLKKVTSDDVKESSIKSKIEDFKNYKASSIDTFGFIPCESENGKSEQFIKKAKKTGIKELVLFKKSNYDITLYLTGNPDGVKTKTFQALVDPCISGAGMVGPLEAFEDHLLWGNYMCSTGIALKESDPGYEDYVACTKVSQEIEDYFDSVK